MGMIIALLQSVSSKKSTSASGNHRRFAIQVRTARDMTKIQKVTPISNSNNTLPEEPTFASGDLGQIQEILVGAQQRQTIEQLNQLNSALTGQIESLSNILNSRLNQLTETLDQSTRDHAEKLMALESRHASDMEELNASFSQSADEVKTELTDLKKKSNADTGHLQSSLDATKSELTTLLTESNNSIRSELKASAEELQSNKLDKHNLAQLLTGISGQLSADKQ